jgi:hypothetical protein
VKQTGKQSGKQGQLDLVGHVLDRQILDKDEMPCGKVDGIEFVTRDDGSLEVAALLVGPGAALVRLPALFEWIGKKIFGTSVVLVPWDKVDETPRVVRLKVTARSLHLEESRHFPFRIIEKIPWSSKG